MTANDTPEKVAKAKKLRKITAIFLLVALAVGIGWDIFVATNDVDGDTVSELTRDLSHNYWILPFAAMGVMGHLFLNIKTKTERTRNIRAMVIACALVGTRDLVNYFYPLPTFFYASFVVGAVGFVLGTWWWPQIYTAEPDKTSPDVDVNAGEGVEA